MKGNDLGKEKRIQKVNGWQREAVKAVGRRGGEQTRAEATIMQKRLEVGDTTLV